jgi:hypothetical protein
MSSMKYQVISAFIDKRTGRQVEAGEALPEGLDKETVDRLVQAKCLRPRKEPEPPTDTGAASGQKTDSSSDLFGADRGGGSGDDAGEAAGAGDGENASEGEHASEPDGADSPADGKAAAGRKSRAKK